MVSKKLMAPTLAGTGAIGATGSLAWALGLFDGEGLENNVKEKKAPPKPAASAPVRKVQGSVELPGRTIIRSLVITGQQAERQYFKNGKASNEDKQAIEKSLTWRMEWNKGLKSLWIYAEEPRNEDATYFSWKCHLKPIFLDETYDYHDLTEFEFQGSELIKAIETNKTHREQFVENCSKRRPYGQVSADSSSSEIYLEIVEYKNNKFSFKTEGGYFQKLWTEDFSGVDILSSKDEELMDVTFGKWNIEEIKGVADKTKKIKISAKEKNWDCHVSGNYSKNLKGKTFKEKEFKEEFLELYKNSGDKIEKKRYLIRNCVKNQKDIKGLTIRETNDGKWEFEDLKKITEGMYTNPTAT